MRSSHVMVGRGLVLAVWCVLCPVARAGNCWAIGKKGRCTDLLQTGVTREACCAGGRQPAAWSPRDLEDGRLFFWRVIEGGVPCKPCKATCAKVKCPKGQKCRRRAGVPRCVCAPKCRALRAGPGPVCGSDGRTYRNACKLLRRQCRKKNGLTLAYKGECQESCDSIKCANAGEQCVLDQNRQPHCVRCLRKCHDRKPNPVCGVNGVTYTSRCHARQAACLLGEAIPTAYRGPCRPGLTCERLRCKSGQRCLLSPGAAA
ncbi:follistatin-like, partial [Pollicipes pollicipes]|uniref:follistatin-like n=1 Tax=Pollicipes pollicipes TaxID=41117 RepID=UPI001884C105